MDERIKVSIVNRSSKTNIVLRWTDPTTGRPATKSSGTANMKLAEDERVRLEDKLNSGQGARLVRVSWKVFCDRYANEKLEGRRLNTRRHFWTAINSLNAFVKLNKPAELTPARISKWQAWLRSQSIAESTIASYATAIVTALGWAKRQQMIHTVPAVEKQKASKRKRHMKGRPITETEFARILAVVEPTVATTLRPNRARKLRELAGDKDALVLHWQRYLRALWLSGLRLEESLDLSWEEDEDLVVDLSGQYPRLRISAEAQKSDADELLPLTPDFAEFLLATPEDQRFGFVFPFPWSTDWVGKMVGRFGEAAGVVTDRKAERFATAHDFRRTFGTRWAQRVMPAMLQKLMRHASVETTMKYYVGIGADEVAAQLWSLRPKNEQ